MSFKFRPALLLSSDLGSVRGDVLPHHGAPAGQLCSPAAAIVHGEFGFLNRRLRFSAGLLQGRALRLPLQQRGLRRGDCGGLRLVARHAGVEFCFGCRHAIGLRG